MCTVSFIPKEEGEFIFTSNRDESPNRKTLLPDFYQINDAKLVFPKDEIAGGTWIGVSDKNRLVCLLNGGFKAHVPKKNYRLSRGVIVKNLLTANNAVAEIELIDLNNIEPFTIILVDYKSDLKLYELVWDGKTKYFTNKDLKPTIWSSSLLYSNAIKQKREDWFQDFIETNEDLNHKNVLSFHKNAGDGNKKSDIVMNRGFVRTKSITQFYKMNDSQIFRYEDLQLDKVKEISL